MSKFPLETIRHSAAHIMAAAVNKLFPDVMFDIGPSTAEGFYYDFDINQRLVPEDLEKIENEIKSIINARLPFEYFELSREEASNILQQKKQKYKLERLADIPEGEKISFYKVGDFIDLCRGPHVEHTGQAGVVKLLSIAGSYYRGKESNPMLQRIYGTAFSEKKELHEYLKFLEEAKKRDHRKLGKELDLFSISEQIGGGLVLWHPKGAFVRNVFETYWREEHYKNGYDLLYTPHIGKSQLWETSGHLSFYKDAMYSPMDIDGNDYYVKPMNCPFHIEIYQSKLRSYKELPLRWAELGTVYRYEKSGVLHGLLRVRGFTQDDAHIICTPEQIESEILNVLKFSLNIWKAFGFNNIKAYLATRPEKAVGAPEKWEKALISLEKAVHELGLECQVDEGGGAFYGPKIDLKIKDAIGREWQMSTIQFDFNLPERFGMTYIGEDGQKHQPFMVHRALLGSIERFFGILVEHYNGGFPLWLAPEQIRILAITDSHHAYAKELVKELRVSGYRAEADIRSETIGAKIKTARNDRIPYICVVGDKEASDRSVSVRSRNEGEIGAMPFEKLKEKLASDIVSKV
ncbi:MAG TPA: threonine--tRNA ligase [Lentisphaeria bacterium]|nr:MAG: threonine--tRNA ligase [Lentisphaerae bacterium GWF2_38_69]HBM14993.1 threonine--tRNA ligase [Lentisphaeria bacterium]